jgi:hypothetical protein
MKCNCDQYSTQIRRHGFNGHGFHASEIQVCLRPSSANQQAKWLPITGRVLLLVFFIISCTAGENVRHDIKRIKKVQTQCYRIAVDRRPSKTQQPLNPYIRKCDSKTSETTHRIQSRRVFFLRNFLVRYLR